MIGRIASAAYQLHFVALANNIIDRPGTSNEMHRQLQPRRRCIICLYNSKGHFTNPSLITKQNTLVLKLVSYEWRLVNVSPVIAKEDDGMAVLSVYIEKTFYMPFITNKTEHISFKSGCVIRVVKHLNRDWFIALH